MDIIKKIAEELSVKTSQVDAAVKLIDEGCTIPFIARYRKEVTGALNDEQLRELDDRLKYVILKIERHRLLQVLRNRVSLQMSLRNRYLKQKPWCL